MLKNFPGLDFSNVKVEMGTAQGNRYMEHLNPLIRALPGKPGVYQYYDENGKLLYVGKAKDLRKRVLSYFSKVRPQNNKLAILIRKIAHIEHIVVSSETDALLLENNLVKKHQPRYNVMLRDDKTFPWICVKNESFPRVFSTRNRVRDGSVYYGPYTSVVMVRTLLEMIRQLYPLRTCRLNLSKDQIARRGYKVCLEYHLGNCKGPCVGEQDEQEYMLFIKQVHQILKGDIKQVLKGLKKLMKDLSEDHKFEEAHSIKEKIGMVERYRSKSTIVNPRINNVDVFTISEEDDNAFVNYLKVMEGAVIQAHTVELKKRLDESREDLLSIAIVDIRQSVQSEAGLILVPFELDLTLENVKLVVPQRGDKKQLLELSARNAKYHRLEKKKRLETLKSATTPARIMEAVRRDLHLKAMPLHIECFDNSNLQGSNPVAACVVFRNAKPSRKEYRHFNIKTVAGQNDFASMEEIVFRRYRRMKEESRSQPQLVIIDGGKGQLNAAMRGLEKLGLRGSVTVIGIAKKLEEIYFPGDKIPLFLDKNSETLKIIQQLRNEAHRFGIEFHRKQRTREMTVSVLDSIPGIGPGTRDVLIQRLGSVENIKKADFEDIAAIIGKVKAGLVRDHFSRSTT